MLNVQFKKLVPEAVLPTQGTPGSAGWDLHVLCGAHGNNRFPLYAGQAHLFRTGLALAIPPGLVGLVMPRSGLGVKHGITIGNGVGVIDSDYRGELMISLYNRNPAESGRSYLVTSGDRVAQILFMPYAAIGMEEVQTLDETARGVGGLGSTGKR